MNYKLNYETYKAGSALVALTLFCLEPNRQV